MSQHIVVDIVAAVVGALACAFTSNGDAKRLGGYLFFAGALAALMAQR